MKRMINTMRIPIMLTTLLLSALHMKAQQNNFSVPDTPPSPQAVAFNRLGDYQVNNNYGAPDISIPLFEIDFHGYKIPLALHYEATPMKPGYNYDVTGFGWTLSGNSCVSRTIKDRADEYGRFNNPFALDDLSLRYMDFANELDQMNFQYDSYNIVLPSGRTIPFFMYKFNGVMQYDFMSKDSNVKIECSYSTSGLHSINTFTVTDENGIIYHFTLADQCSNGFESDPNFFRNVTWLLTSIDIPSKGTITYNYTPLQTIYTYSYDEPGIRVSRMTSEMQEDVNERRINVIRVPQPQCPRYKMRLLSSINYGPTTVVFNYLSDGCHMKEIVVYDCNTLIKKYSLGISGSSLTSLVISGQNDADKLKYGFTYSNCFSGNVTDFWGNICGYGTQNDLGNFNMYFDYVGIDTTNFKSNLSYDGNPAQFISTKPDDPNYYYKIKLQSTTNGEVRQPTSPNEHGVLTCITYPNGGHTLFTWENHRFPTASAADGDLVFDRRSQRIIEGGGFRIESITNWAADGSIVSKDYYRYGYTVGDIIRRNFPLPLSGIISLTDTLNHHIGCGEAVVDPNLLTFMSFTYSQNISSGSPSEFRKMTVGLPSTFRNICNFNGRATWWDAYFSANTFRSLLGGRRPVVYPEITVYHGHPFEPSECKSKTVYRYDIYSYQHDPYTYYMSSFNQTSLPDTAYYEPLCYYSDGPDLKCLENAAKRHQLKSKSDYSYNAINGKWELVSEETYSYSEESMTKSGYIFDSYFSRGHCGRHTFQLAAIQPIEYYTLSNFYKPFNFNMGRCTMTEKSVTVLRQGGTRTEDNTLTEEYSYLYPGVMKYRYYTDIYNKEDSYSYIGEQEGAPNSVIETMKSRNMLASLVSAETCPPDWPSVITGSKIDYGYYNNEQNILPYKLYERNGSAYEESLQVVSYDSYGNPWEIVDLKTGMHTVYLWDIYGRYLIAIIKNATWDQVQNTYPQLLTGTSLSRYTALKALLPDAQIQTWAYIPLIGVSSRTDVNGSTILYEYDGLGRLKAEKRLVNGVSDPEFLHKYEYNYRNSGL